MQSTNFHYLPPFFGILLLLFGLLIAVLQVGVMGYAYEKMGISRLRRMLPPTHDTELYEM
jgi:uncharacterized membrane protein